MNYIDNLSEEARSDVRLRLFLDLFSLTNNYAARTITTAQETKRKGPDHW